MKKAIALILICMMLLSTAACTCFKKIEGKLDEVVHPSETESAGSTETDQEPEAQDSAKVTDKPAQEPSEAPESGKTTPKPAEEPKHAAYTIDNAVIVDNEYCKVTLIAGTESADGGVAFKFLLENKTADKEQMFSVDDVAVNGWILTTAGLIETVKAGKKANETMTITASDMEEYGLTSADKLAFSLRVYDNNDWLADNFVDDSFTLYPTGMTEAEVVSPERQKTAEEMVVVDNDNCAFVILDAAEDSFWGYTLSVYLENKTDHAVMFTWNDVYVNGYMIDPFWANSIPAGSKKLSHIRFDDSKFADNGIKDVEEIEFELRAYDDDNWSAPDFVKDTFTYKPGSPATAGQTVEATAKPTAGTSQYTDADIVGTWTLTSAKAMGMTLPASTLGLEMSFTFNADGTASMYYENETTEGLTWKLEGNLVKLGAYGVDLYDFVFDGETLTIHEDENDVDLIFSK